MESARSLALGGKIIHAEDRILAIHNATDLMLRCSFCGEPVFHKSGLERKRHFSHFKDLPDRQLEECEERQKAANTSAIGSSGYSARGQSLELFQANIIEIFSINNNDFEDLISSSDERVKHLSQRFCQIYKDRYSDVFDVSRKKCRDNFKNETLNRIMHRENILLEVISYLRNISATRMLEKLFVYVIQKITELQEASGLSKGQSTVSAIHVNTDEVLVNLCSMLAVCPWLEAFIDIENRREIDKSLGLNFSLRSKDNYNEEVDIDDPPKTGGAKPVNGRDLEISIELTSDEFLKGCYKTISLERKVICSSCMGFTSTARRKWEKNPKRCPNCNGKLRLLVNEPHSFWINAGEHRSPNIYYFGVCRRHINVRIPELGHEGINGGKNGNLVLNVYADVDYGQPKVTFPWHSF